MKKDNETFPMGGTHGVSIEDYKKNVAIKILLIEQLGRLPTEEEIEETEIASSLSEDECGLIFHQFIMDQGRPYF
jgi:hypothetical protein